MSKGGESNMEATVEQTEIITEMAKPKKTKSSTKKSSYKPYALRAKTPKKPKRKK